MSNKKFRKQKKPVKAVVTKKQLDDMILTKAQKWGEKIAKSLATYFMVSAELYKRDVQEYDGPLLQLMAQPHGYDGIVDSIFVEMEDELPNLYKGGKYNADECFNRLNDELKQMQNDCKCPILIDLENLEEYPSALIEKIRKVYPKEKLLDDTYIDYFERSCRSRDDEERAKAARIFENALWKKIVYAIKKIPNREIDSAIKTILVEKGILDKSGKLVKVAYDEYVNSDLTDSDEILCDDPKMKFRRKIALELYHGEVLFHGELRTLIRLFLEWIATNHGLYFITDSNGEFFNCENDHIYPIIRKRIIDRIVTVFHI